MTIRYNMLNLPELIQFKNGNQIRNLYDAAGRKLETRVTTWLMGVYQPLNPGQVIENLDVNELEMVSINGTSYAGNMEYSISRYFDWDIRYQAVDLLNLTRIHNSEGYVTTLKTSPGTGPIYHYYRRDHLGNNREVWRAEHLWSNNTRPASTAQRTQYYPSGLPWKFSTDDGASTQPYKYNGKEFVEAHGLDEYDSEARWYCPAIMRTTTPDPHAENYYNTSPYAWCGNNPVNRVDLDGRDWYEAENGTVTWTDYTSQKDLDDNKIKGAYLGQAHVVFNGSRQEQPSTQNGKKYIVGEGALNADVTVYGTGGADDIQNFTGYTMTSNSDKYIPIDEGLYSLDYMNPGKGGALPSRWAVNGTGKVPTMDEVPNSNPDTKGEWNYMTPWKTGIYVHSTGKNGGLGTRNSTGCLLILDSQWNDFNSVMQGITRSSVRVTRTDVQRMPLKGIAGAVPNVYIPQKITRR